MTMKALVHTRPYCFELKEVATPIAGRGELLVRIKAVGICGSDIHGASGKTGRRKPPLIMGHEAAGVVAEIGGGAARFRVGDRITFDSTIYCGACVFCKTGHINLCDRRKVLGVSCDDYRCDGAMAEYVVIPERIAYLIPEGMSFPEACLVEAAAIAMHAVHRTALRMGDKCAVVGAGLIGLLAISLLKTRGCGRLLAVDIDDERLDLAKRFGADEAINLAKMPERVPAGFADAVIEAVGIQETILTAIKLARKGGTVTAIGNLAAGVEFPLQKVVTREIVFNGSCASAGEYPVCIEFISSGKLNVQALISKVIPLAEGARYFDLLVHGKGKFLKVILEP